mgnify:CR=1 FL=1
MRISLDQVEALVWIARLGSFRAAAHQLNVSQPAISGRIRELERQLGGRGVLMGGASGVRPAQVVVLGGGMAGWPSFRWQLDAAVFVQI